MRIAVLGAGAMGAIFGAALSRAGGADLVFFDRRPEVVEAISRHGLQLSGVLGTATLRLPATADPTTLGAVDLALVLVDAGATAAVAEVAQGCLKRDGFALTLQNGIGNWEALAAKLGRHRVMAGSTFNSGAAVAPGRSVHTNLGPTWIGELDGAISDRAKAIAGLFEAGGLPFKLVANVVAVVWSKFVHNCAINPIAAATGLRPGEIARDADAAALLDSILEEVLAVVAAEGISLPEADPRAHIRDHCWERYNRPSMLQHIESGRGSEIDSLNAALVRRAKAHGIPVPANEAMVRVIKGREAAARRDGSKLHEAALEAAARADPRNDRWGVPG
jgi:2-dehydropantoate 2-reductase